MSQIRSLGYLRIEATDTGAWREFGTRLLGMVEGRGPEPGAVYLRMDDFPARLVIVPGQTDRLLASGWEVATEADLTVLGQAVERIGVPVKTGEPEELDSRRSRGCCGSKTRRATPSRHSAVRRWTAGRCSARTAAASSRGI